MLVRAPISIQCTSPRTTAVGQIDKSSPMLHPADHDRCRIDVDARAQHGSDVAIGSDVHVSASLTAHDLAGLYCATGPRRRYFPRGVLLTKIDAP